MSDLQYTLGLDGSQFDATARGAEKTGMRLGSVLAGLGVTAFAGSMLRRGFEFNQTMRDSEAAVAKVIGQFQHLDAVAAKDSAAAAMRQIIELEPKAAGSLADLTGGFLATLAASQAAGLSVSQNIDLVGRFANAMANANIPTEQLGQEMRSIVTANIGADSSLARILGITNEMVKQAQQAGNLYGFLAEKIGKMGEAGDTAAVAFSTLQSAIDKAAGSLASGLFDAALDGSKGLTTTLDENRDAFTNLGAAIGLAATEVVKFGGFVNEAAAAVAKYVAIAGLMLQDGTSYADAADAVDAVAASRLRDAEAAKQQAAAIKATLDAASKGSDAKQSAKEQAAAATAKAGLTNPAPGAPGSSGSRTKTKAPDGFDAEAAGNAFDEILDKQAKLDAAKRESAMAELGTGAKAMAVGEEILKIEQQIAALRADPFKSNQQEILDAETKKIELQSQQRELQKEMLADSDKATQKAEQQAKAQKDQADQMAAGRNDLLGEMAILDAQSKGQDKKAAAIKRQLQIERDKMDIMRQTGAGEDEALRLATKKADLEAAVAKRGAKGDGSKGGGSDGGRRTIKGYSQSQSGSNGLMGSPGGGGLDAMKAQDQSAYAKLQAGGFGADGLAGRGATSTTGEATKRVSLLMGQTDARPLSERGQAVLTPPAKPGDNSAKAPSQDPQGGKLDAILTELTRIRTA